MGLFDSLKSAVNFVTGGAAKVNLEIGPRAPDGSFPAKITGVAENDLKIAKVYLKIEGTETVTVKLKKEGSTMTTDHVETSKTYEQEMVVAPEQTMAKQQGYAWEAVIRIPPDAQPTYTGKLARHEWRAYAAVDASGTDPASSWVTFKV